MTKVAARRPSERRTRIALFAAGIVASLLWLAAPASIPASAVARLSGPDVQLARGGYGGAGAPTLTASTGAATSLSTASAPPEITFQPAPQATILGGEAIFTVIAGGDAPLSYQWRKDGLDLSDGPGVSGAATDVLMLSDAEFDDAGAYLVVVTNSAGSAISADASLTVSVPQGGDVDFSFDPGSSINGAVLAVAVQRDGKVLIGGDFTMVTGAVRGRIARLNPDGTTDHTFLNGMSGASSTVTSVALQPDGKVLIGGWFTTVNGVSRNRIARLNVDGSLDTSFQEGMTGAAGEVRSVALQPDGKVLIGGTFTTVNGVSRNRIGRLNVDGSLDTSFLNGMTGATGEVNPVVLQPDGKVLIGGFFTTVNGVSRNRIARLNADGGLDTSFQDAMSGANNPVYSLDLQPDGKVLIGGFFTMVNGVTRNRVARLNADGSLDTSFVPIGYTTIYSVAVQADGKVLIAGTLSSFPLVAIARLNDDGSLDTTFLNGMDGPDGSVASVTLQPDGKVLIAGGFTMVNGVSRSRIARLNADGSLDTSFLNGTNGGASPTSVALQPGGQVLIGGYFTTVNGVSRNRIARLNADGSLDTSFLNGMTGASGQAGANPTIVYSVVLQPDGNVLIGGHVTAVNGVRRRCVARLNADGSLDTSFQDPAVDRHNALEVYSVALQSDGKVLIGGYFVTVGGASRWGLARLNADGSLDTSFVPYGYNTIYSLAVQADGKVLIAGTLSSLPLVGIARLNSDGTSTRAS